MKTFFSPSQAITVIGTALQSGSIKLSGNEGDGVTPATDMAERNANADAAYLLQLLRKLTTDSQN